MQSIRRTLMVLSLFALAQPVAAQQYTLLKHDDGTQEDKRSMTGGGHAVAFECPDEEKWYVNAVSIRGARYGTPQPPDEDFQVVIANQDLSERLEFKRPYALFNRGAEKWVKVDIEPAEVQGTFHVAAFFNPTRTMGVYVGIDTDSSPTHSAILLASAPDKKQSDLQGDWMIRAFVTKEIDGEAKSLLNATARAEQMQEDEAARDAAILGDARSLTLKQDMGPMDDHLNIRGALYTLAFETPENVEGYLWEVQIFASQFGGRHDSEAVSGDVYVLDENRRIISRTTFPYSLTAQAKQWVSIPTLATKVQGKFYVSIDTHGTSTKGIYMGYQDGNQQSIATTDELKDNHVQTADWSKKFENMQWLIRAKIADRPVVY